MSSYMTFSKLELLSYDRKGNTKSLASVTIGDRDCAVGLCFACPTTAAMELTAHAALTGRDFAKSEHAE